MAIIKLTSEDITFLSNNYQRLSYDEVRNVVYGILNFDLKYEELGETIIDEYEIEIDLNRVSDLGLPIVREVANRIVNIAATKGVKIEDLHLNDSTGEMCIIIPPKVKERYPNGFDLQELINHIQEHLYWISYYEKFDKEPWKAHGHGDLGYLELYLKNKEKYGEDCKKYFRCANRRILKKKIVELKKKYKL